MLTQFQRTYIEQVQKRPDFSCFVEDYLNDSVQIERVINLLFYTTDKKLHLHRIGRKRLIRAISSQSCSIHTRINSPLVDK
jgi:hypothetical protein